MFVKIDSLLHRLNRKLIFGISIVMMALIGLADYLSWEGLSFALFYLGPVALAAWYVGRRAGVFTSLLACLVWYLVDVQSSAGGEPLAIPIWNALVRFGFFLSNALLLASLHRYLVSEKKLARTDPMTGVMNSRAFSEQLNSSLKFNRRSARGLTLAYVDLDDFKRINDTLGHTEGDRVLRGVAQALRKSSRKTDVVARLGGDEFALLLPQTDLKGAATVMNGIKEHLQNLTLTGNINVSCSIGAVVFEDHPPSASAAVKAADHLMYQVKRQGKNAVAFGVYDPQTGEALRQDLHPEPIMVRH